LLDVGYRVTAVDASREMLDIATATVPEANLIHGDLLNIDFPRRFDGIVAWDSIFHIARKNHAAMFARFARWLSPGGVLLLSLGGSEWEDTAPMLGHDSF